MNEIVEYIISFLLYGHQELAGLIGYSDDVSASNGHRVVIQSCGHLGKDIVVPDLSAPVVVDGTPVVIKTDIIYNTFFFISRAEELLNTQRDEHGRFMAAYSILGQGNNLFYPLIDEYAHILINSLEKTYENNSDSCPVHMPSPGIRRICLTHDIDTIAHYRHFRGWMGGVLRGHFRDACLSLKDIHNDPAFTFPWLIRTDSAVTDAESIYFVKHTSGYGYDYPQYDVLGRDFRIVENMLLESGACMGWHSSYYGVSDDKVHSALHRSHYLNCSLDTMARLADMGVLHDFSMAFPDRAGFRLQTTRPVRWIDPRLFRLTSLVLHPLAVMDCTLSNSCYMNLTEDEAFLLCECLIDKVRQYAGELVLLWHNSNVDGVSYHRSLYPKVLSLL